MQNNFFNRNNLNKEKIMTYAAIIIGLVILFWILYPMKEGYNAVNDANTTNENQQDNQINTEEINNIPEDNGAVNPPYVDPMAGALMDGPGFERGPIEGATEFSDSIPSNYYFLDDGAGGAVSAQHMLCSKSCCSDQWPTPFNQKYDPYVCANKDKFVPSRYMCNNTFQDSGCLCLPKKGAAHIYNRGGNGREWF